MTAPRRFEATILSRASGAEAEILQEKAANLQRLGHRLEQALEDLRGAQGEERERLLAAAGEALWYYVVQREVCGLRDTEQLMRELSVPREVQLRMGVRTRREGR